MSLPASEAFSLKMEVEETNGDVSFDNLYEAILQCFVIILSGYMAGRIGLVNASQAAGIGTFVSKFCLPALLFQNMCTLEFSKVSIIDMCAVFFFLCMYIFFLHI